MHEATLITGDGIGPEIAQAARECVDSCGVKVDWDIIEGASLDEMLESVRETRVALKAPITTAVAGGGRSLNVGLRQGLDLYASVRPCRSLKGIPNAVGGVDVVVVRENTEDLYVGIEYGKGRDDTRQLINFVGDTRGIRLKDDSAISIKSISASGSKRIAEYAFKWAQTNGRRKVTSATKANIMKETDGVFMRAAREVAGNHEKIAHEHMLIDALCMRLAVEPAGFDVILAPNLYGDIVSDLAAGLTGGLGLAPGANYGSGHAVFEPAHGSAPDIAGNGIANPSAMILSAAMMLEHIGEGGAASRLRKAVEKVIAEGAHVTRDIKSGSDTTTDEMAAAVAEAL